VVLGSLAVVVEVVVCAETYVPDTTKIQRRAVRK
jgi:hypothetical protein